MLCIEMIKIKHGYSREIVTNIPSVNTLFHGSESISFEIQKNWEIAPVKISEFISLNSFK